MAYSFKKHLARLERKLDALMSAQNLELLMEMTEMADFKKLIEEVRATKGAADSTRKFVQGLESRLSEMSSNMNDDEDQRQVEELSKELAAIRETLPHAVEENTDTGVPGSGQSNPGGSTGGIQG